MPADPSSLEQIERWMHQLITHQGGVLAAADEAQIDSVVTRSKALSATERVEIYADSYFWRLIDIMAEEYPTTRHVIGVERFAELCRAYVTAHPSTSWTLCDLTCKFPAYLADEAEQVPHREVVVDLARIERAMEDVFDAPARTPVTVDELLAIPQEHWPEARFEMIPALELIALDHPIDDYITAVCEERHLDLPQAQAAWMAVWRNDFRVWRKPLTEAEFTLLCALQSGGTLGQALEVCANLPDLDLQAFIGNLQDWFRQWTGEGFFSSVA